MMKEIMSPSPPLHSRRLDPRQDDVDPQRRLITGVAHGGGLRQLLLPNHLYFIRQVRIREPVDPAEHVPGASVEATGRDIDVLRFDSHPADPAGTRLIFRESQQPPADAPPAILGMNPNVPKERDVSRS